MKPTRSGYFVTVSCSNSTTFFGLFLKAGPLKSGHSASTISQPDLVANVSMISPLSPVGPPSGPIAQFTPQDLAYVALGQVVQELHLARNLVAGQVLAAVLDEHVLGEIRRLLHHVDLHRLAGVGVWLADRCHFEHAWVHHHHFFNLIRIDIEARHQ